MPIIRNTNTAYRIWWPTLESRMQSGHILRAVHTSSSPALHDPGCFPGLVTKIGSHYSYSWWRARWCPKHVESINFIYCRIWLVLYLTQCLRCRGGVRSTRVLGPTITARGRVSVSRLICYRKHWLSKDYINFRDLAHEFSCFIIHIFVFLLGRHEAIMVQKTSKYYTTEFDLEGF
jgi:hypothetical protein